MPNAFYSSFDAETFGNRHRRDDEFRSEFQIDRDRIIHTSAFRSLQSKTQVFLSGEYDFYRTRLTHSIEVAQIGRSICTALQSQSSNLDSDFHIDPDLVEASCLSHDIGHPPFGHCGERTLNQLMKGYGGFEGNAQTLRLLTETIFATGGMLPTRSFIDGVLKYKTLYGELENPNHHFLYDHQSEHLDFALDGRDFPSELSPGKPRNSFRSIECQIMDWADDTAYSLNDISDGIHAGFLTIERIERWAENQDLSAGEDAIIESLLRTIRKGNIEAKTGINIGRFVSACQLVDDANFMSPTTNRYRFRLAIDPEIAAECSLYERLSLDLVFKSQQLQQLDRKAAMILGRLFECFAEFYIAPDSPGPDHMQLLSPAEEAMIRDQKDEAARARIVCDVIARMTDGFATRTYKRMFEADFGSIVDLV